MNTSLSCWVITDGRRGIENQALGLAEAVSRLREFEIERKKITPNRLFKAAQPGFQLAIKSEPENYGLKPPYPAIAIGCGRQAIAPLRALKKHCGSNIFSVYVQDPRIDPSHFDLVISPEHDALTGPNVFPVIGSPNRVTNERIVVDTLKFNKMIATLSTPRVAMLIGGNSKTHKLDEESHAKHMDAANAVLDSGASLMLTVSRRTPQFVRDAYYKLASNNVKIWFDDGQGENPFFAMLGASDTILVTEDSTNMLTEACATGKPVFTLPMSGKAGKFSQLYDQLQQRCHVTRFMGKLESDSYVALKETDRAAAEILRRFAQAQ